MRDGWKAREGWGVLDKWERRTASASGFTPFSIMEMQMERVRRSRWQFCGCFRVESVLSFCFLVVLGVAD